MAADAKHAAIWLDCDPGHDDAMAILLAGHTPSLTLLGISTVHGNMPLELTTANALKVANVAGLNHIPVVAGAAKPLMRLSKACPEIHGETGLDTCDGFVWPPLPEGRALVRGKAIHVMFEHIEKYAKEHDAKVTLLATGCLTNVALLVSVYPEIAAYLDEIVLMGGACGRGNTNPVAEFNIQVDPEAAAIVFACGIRVVMVPLEVTHTALVTPAVLRSVSLGVPLEAAGVVNVGPDVPLFEREEALARAVTPLRRLVVSLLQFFASTYLSLFDMAHPPLHDPCAVFAVIDRAKFKVKRCHVDIETSSPFSAGQTVVDLLNINNHAEEQKNVDVALAMDVHAFWETMLKAIAAADAVSCLNKA